MNDEDRDDIRAVFAGLAMSSLLSSDSPRPTDVSEYRTYNPDGSLLNTEQLPFAEQVARDAVIHADALLEALKRRQ